jgi:hypothetical protein
VTLVTGVAPATGAVTPAMAAVLMTVVPELITTLVIRIEPCVTVTVANVVPPPLVLLMVTT